MIHIEDYIENTRHREAPTDEERNSYLSAYIKVYCDMKNENFTGLYTYQKEWLEDELRAEHTRVKRPRKVKHDDETQRLIDFWLND